MKRYCRPVDDCTCFDYDDDDDDDDGADGDADGDYPRLLRFLGRG